MSACNCPEPYYARGMCKPCYYRWWRRQRRTKGVNASPYDPIRHGTPQGYQRHRYRGEDTCGPCRRAWRDLHRRYRGSRVSDIPRQRDSIIDVLTTHGRWMTANQVADWVTDRHPEWQPESIRRALVRLADQSVVSVRIIDGHAEWHDDDEAWEKVS